MTGHETKAQIEARLFPDGLPPEGRWPTERTGMVNVYFCEEGRHWIKVRLSDSGTTPFLLGCRQCDQVMRSFAYTRPPDSLGVMGRQMRESDPTHEFYRPDTTEGLDQLEREHVRDGGLLLREIPAGGSESDGQGS